MIKLKEIVKSIRDVPESEFVNDIDKKYLIAESHVDGREVLRTLDNASSISATLDDYIVLKGIREVPMSDFHLTGKHYSVSGTKRIQELARKIEESNTISPLIVVVDKEGPYILEGSHRIEALYLLKAKSFPAAVVIDLENI